MAVSRNTAISAVTPLPFAGDVAIPTDDVRQMDVQFRKTLAYVRWSGIPLSVPKCEVAGILYRSYKQRLVKSSCDTQSLKEMLSNRFTSGDVSMPYLSPEKPYNYLGVHVTLTMDWNHHFQYVQASVNSKCLSLAAAHVGPKSALRIIKTR